MTEPRPTAEQLTEQLKEINVFLRGPQKEPVESDKDFEKRRESHASKRAAFVAEKTEQLAAQRQAFEAARLVVPQVLLDALNALNRATNAVHRMPDAQYLAKSRAAQGDKDSTAELVELLKQQVTAQAKRLEVVEQLLIDREKKGR